MAQKQVTWTIDVDSDSDLEAAKLALEIMRDVDSEALAFEVKTMSTGDIESINL